MLLIKEFQSFLNLRGRYKEWFLQRNFVIDFKVSSLMSRHSCWCNHFVPWRMIPHGRNYCHFVVILICAVTRLSVECQLNDCQSIVTPYKRPISFSDSWFLRKVKSTEWISVAIPAILNYLSSSTRPSLRVSRIRVAMYGDDVCQLLSFSKRLLWNIFLCRPTVSQNQYLGRHVKWMCHVCPFLYAT